MEKIYEYIAILTVILLSGSIYFSIYNKFLLIILIIISFILFIKNKKVNKKNIIILIVFSFSILLQCLLSIEYKPNIKDYLYILLDILIIFCLVSNININNFKNKYVNIMVIISLISIISFMLIQLNIRLPLQRTMVINNSIYEATPYYTVGRYWYDLSYVVTDRNNGVFWEPGAFQAFLNIGLLIIISLGEKCNFFKMKSIILILALLTTKSATGYIILLLISLIFIIKSLHIKFDLKKMVLSLIVFISVFTILLNNEVVYDKLINKNQSYNTRMLDTTESLKLTLEKPLMGYGYKSDMHKNREAELGINQNSNGLFLISASMGIVILIIYLIFLVKGINNFFYENFFLRLITLLIFIIIHSTEYFMFHLIFLIFIFQWNESNMKKGIEILGDVNEK